MTMAMVFAAFVVAVATGSGFPENERWLGGFPRNASCDRGEFPLYAHLKMLGIIVVYKHGKESHKL